MTNYFRKPDALVDAVRSILSGQPTETQEDIQHKSDVKMVKVTLPDGHMVMRRERPKIEIGKGKNESLDPVDQKALKGKHSDRKDKDIDNDGDVDSSDEYLHKRRKAIFKNQVQTAEEQFEDDPEFLEIYLEALHMMEQNVVNELSDKTVNSYIGKAAAQHRKQKNRLYSHGDYDGNQHRKREAGLRRATGTNPNSASGFTKTKKELVKARKSTTEETVLEDYSKDLHDYHNDMSDHHYDKSEHHDSAASHHGRNGNQRAQDSHISASKSHDRASNSHYDAAQALKKHGHQSQQYKDAASKAKKHSDTADRSGFGSNSAYPVKESLEDNPANRQHLCAKNVVHESWGEGSCIPTMHADPDEEGNVAWYDVMFDHGIEEQVSIEELKVTKAESHIHSSKKKIKKSKDEYEDDDDDSDEDEKNGKKKKVSGKKDDVDVEPEMDDTKMVTEKEMTPAQEKKREEIVLSMKKEMPRFKKKYGDRAKDVMYATATKMAMREGFELGIEKSDLIEEVELDEAKIAKKVPAKDGGHFVVLHRDTSGMRGTQDKFHMRHHLKNGKVKDYGSHPSMDGALKFAKNRGIIEEVELDEAKSGTGYDLYHKDFSSAMQHAYDHAKKKHGITINPKEIDDKVATGPAKPKEGKTNSYRLKGDKGVIQVQVYNKGGSKPFELNMYKEEVELDEAKVTKKMIDDLEDRNEHGMVALKLAQAYGTAAEVKKVQDINKRHNQRGHIEHKDQKERDVIIRKYYKMAEEVELDEVGGAAFGGTIDKIQKVVDDKTAMKIDGVMVDTFTASLIMNIFKKVNKQNQDKMRKMKVTQLANAAYKLSGVKEEVELDEGRGRPRKDGTTGGSEDRENIQMQLRKSVSLRGLKDVEFADGNKVKVPAKVAQGVMSKINSIKDAKQKQNAVQHIAKSHKHMMDFHKGDYKDADAKRQDILKLK